MALLDWEVKLGAGPTQATYYSSPQSLSQYLVLRPDCIVVATWSADQHARASRAATGCMRGR